ncbi:MAG TPA: aspartate aminotransferase family protein [Acidothermaceae bacterium]
MAFDLGELLEARRGENYELQAKYVNQQVPRVLRAIGFDKIYDLADGCYLIDNEGNRYLDMLAGFGVFALGRNHPVVRKALKDLLDTGLADMVQFDAPLLAGIFAEKLLARAPGLDRVFFCNSGSESVEAALKFARAATGKPRILYVDHAYHGLTLGTLSVNGSEEFRRGFGPLLPDTAIQMGDLDALRRELRKGDVAALLMEPIQGKGVNIPPSGFMAAAQAELRAHGALLICDEVQTGVGRTGKFFAYEHEGVQPDIVAVAKALSGGFVPIGATMATKAVFDKVYSSMDRVFVHASTFMGNAMAMTAGLATLSVVDDEGLVENAEKTGRLLLERLQPLVDRYELLADVRGRGLMVGIEFGKPKSMKLRASWNMLQAARHGLFAQMVVVPLFQRHRVLTQVAGDHADIIKLIPPLVTSEAEVDLFVEAFTNVMDDAHRGTGLMWDFGRTLITQAVKR